MHSFITLTHYNASHDHGRKRPQYVAGKGLPHTCKEKNTTIKKQQRIIKHPQNALFFTLKYYNVSQDCGRKRPQSVAGKGLPHTCKEKNTTIKNTNTEQLNALKMHSFITLT